MLILPLLLAFIANVHSWNLISTHTNVVPTLTTDVTLRCSNDDVGQKSSLKLVNRIRILKLDNRTSDWRTFVVTGFSTILNSTEPETTLGFSVSGNVGKPTESFLSVTWPLALRDTVGSYKCEVLAFDQQDTIQTLSNMTVSITATSVSVNDLLDIILSMRKRASVERENINELEDFAKVSENNRKSMEGLKTAQGTIKEELEAVEMKHNADNAALTKKFLNFRKNVFGDLNKAIENNVEDRYFEMRNWPLGPAAIPAPEGGCPQTPRDTWVQGYINISGNYGMGSRVSSENHFAQPVLKSNYLSLGFCKKDSTSGIDWPKGSYCIYVGTSASCPKHFGMSYMTINTQSTRYTRVSITISTDHNPFYSSSSSSFHPYFCCRNDGDAGKPIILPTTWSFYLYRYKGKCQSVLNANVTSEWMEMATSSYFRTSYSDSVIHPDGNASNGRLELCYYQGQPDN